MALCPQVAPARADRERHGGALPCMVARTYRLPLELAVSQCVAGRGPDGHARVTSEPARGV
jgi:hypothetical protein